MFHFHWTNERLFRGWWKLDWFLVHACLPCGGRWWSVEVKNDTSHSRTRWSQQMPHDWLHRPHGSASHFCSTPAALLRLCWDPGQLPVSFNWYYHFSVLTEMDHHAWPDRSSLQRARRRTKKTTICFTSNSHFCLRAENKCPVDEFKHI